MMATARCSYSDEPLNLAPFKELLLGTCGFFFEKGREQTLCDALNRRMAAMGFNDADAYQALLRSDSKELVQLVELLTVNETYFLREPDHLNLMVDKLLPSLMGGKSGRPVRILSAGCSTGEEPYSIAIMLRERYGADCERLFSITGVDIDTTAVAIARQGVYGKGSFRGMEPSLLERYFKPCGPGKYRVGENIGRQVRFEVVNLLGANYPQEMLLPDIIFYRNVSIYFPQQIQREIFGRLAGLLGDGGCLIVGATETLHHDIGILSLVEQDSLFFYRKAPTPVFEERRTLSRHTAIAERPSGVSRQVATISPARSESRQSPLPTRRVPDRPLQSLQPAVRQDVRVLFDQAIELAHNKQYEKSLEVLNEIVRQDPAFEKAHCLKGSLLLSMSRFDEAQVVSNEVLGRDPLCLQAYLMLGIIARQKGDDDNAAKRFREALYLNASCWLAHYYSAEISYGQRDEKRARSGYEAALRVLEKGSLKEHGQDFFPLSFNAEQFIVICRHKLSLLAAKKSR